MVKMMVNMMVNMLSSTRKSQYFNNKLDIYTLIKKLTDINRCLTDAANRRLTDV